MEENSLGLDDSMVNPFAGKEFGIWWGNEVFNYKDEKEAIIEHFLYKRDCMWIDSKSGVGKSLLAQHLICNLTSGTPFMDTYHIEGEKKVLLVQTEGDRGETLERLHKIKSTLPIKLDNFCHINWDGLCLNTPEGFNEFITLLKICPIRFDVIIFDPLYTTVKGSLSSDDVATDWIRNVRSIRKVYDCAFIILSHESKESFDNKGKLIEKSDENLFGSAFWLAFANQNFKLREINGEKGLKELHLKRGKNRGGNIVDLIEMQLISTDTMIRLVNKNDIADTTLFTVKKTIEISDVPISTSMIIERTKIPPATVYRVINKLLREKVIDKIKAKYGYVYQISEGVDKVIKEGASDVLLPPTEGEATS